MCGIAGWFGSVPFDGRCAAAMARRLRHRGPDAEGIRAWPHATFVHRRLSIIDLSPAGEQPLSNEDGSVWTVFNGEIYNHHALRDDLESRGHRFRGRADSEVLPHLFEEWPDTFLSRLRGMFAFAVYDDRQRRLLLARDRFGIKPLFYAVLPQGVAFASEIGALQVLPGIDLTVDPQALYDYTALTYIPAPATFFKGIRVLEPGSYLDARATGDHFRYRVGRYHAWTIAPRTDLSMERVVPEADERLTRAVASQLESDVPIGSLLSGGIDSSLVSAAAQAALHPARLRTFNVRFADRAYDETWAARAVADHIGAEHETLDFPEASGTWQQVCDLLLHAGQPFADTSIFAVHAVSRLMRQRIKVALSGDGGDEAFGGYDLYWQLERCVQLRQWPSAVLGAGRLALGLAGLANPKYTRLASRLDGLTRDDTGAVATLFQWVRDEELNRLVPELRVEPIRRHFEPVWQHELPAHAGALERLSAHATEVNARLVLANDFLFKVDTASMRESLEVRVPLLDEDLFALGLSLPHRLKVIGKTGKAVLRELARRRLPDAVAAKPKWGFGVPVDTWVGSDFRTALRETLTARSPIAQFYDPHAYLPLVAAFVDRDGTPAVSRVGLYQRVVMLLAVHLTLEQMTAAAAAQPAAASSLC